MALPELTILGAAYGLGCRTDRVRELQGNSNRIDVVANNDTFGDTWHGRKKSLVIVYQYTGYKPMVAAVKEDERLVISPPDSAAEQAQTSASLPFHILGAAYGPGDVTARANSLIHNHQLEITANNNTFPDSWHGRKKSFVAVFQNEEGRPYMLIVEEGTYISVSSQ